MSKFSVTIIGSSSAKPAHGRNPSAQWLHVENHFYLIDCGEGTLARLMEAKLRYSKVKAIFISHLHGDHYFGLAPLLFTLSLQGRKEPLHLYAPAGLAEILTLQLRYANTSLSYSLYFVAIDPSKPNTCLYQDEVLCVETFPLKHRIPCNGFLFAQKAKSRKLIKEKIPDNLSIEQRKALQKGEDIVYQNQKINNQKWTAAPPPPRVYAYCSDTLYDEQIVPFVSQAHTLYHESTFTQAQKLRAKQTYHSTAQEAAQIAREAKVEKLLLGHFSARYANLTPILEEAKQVFAASFLAEEGKTFKV